MGVMAPTNFEKDAFGTHDGTHEILKSPYNGTHVFKFLTHPLYLILLSFRCILRSSFAKYVMCLECNSLIKIMQIILYCETMT